MVHQVKNRKELKKHERMSIGVIIKHYPPENGSNKGKLQKIWKKRLGDVLRISHLCEQQSTAPLCQYRSCI